MVNQCIRLAKIGDSNDIVSIHLKAFTGFFLSFLGPAFLRVLYEAILEDKSGIVFVGVDGDTMAGFVAGVDQPDGFYSRLLKRKWWRFGLAALGPAIRNPSIIGRLLRAFNKPKEITLPGCASLMSIAVDPQIQSRGIGKALVTEFIQEASKRGLQYVELTTDAVGNEQANRFYQHLGFTCSRSFSTPEGRRMNEYIYRLKS